jgi:hypothetical protein
MPARWVIGLFVCLATVSASLPLPAQAPTPGAAAPGEVPPAAHHFKHNKKMEASYDSVADSTSLSVVTHKGKYFISSQRPRLTWTVRYPGRSPGESPPAAVVLEFRTQGADTPTDNRLVIDFGEKRRVEVASTGAFSDPGVQTTSHFMRFPVPTDSLVTALASGRMAVTVGGIAQKFKADEMEALRDLLDRVGAWPAAPASEAR